jgi:phosphomethylpyrimidine synthase
MCSPDFCSMKITEDERKYAAEHGLNEEAVVKRGFEAKAAEFTQKGTDVYVKP